MSLLENSLAPTILLWADLGTGAGSVKVLPWTQLLRRFKVSSSVGAWRVPVSPNTDLLSLRCVPSRPSPRPALSGNLENLWFTLGQRT